MNEKERKKQKRKQLLLLLNQDPEWHKKDNELMGAIQEKAREISFAEQEVLLELNIRNYRMLCESNVPIKEMHRMFGLSEGKFYLWRKEHGFCKQIKGEKV